MFDEESLRVAGNEASIRLKAGVSKALEEVSQRPSAVADVAEQRAFRISGHLTGAMKVPVHETEIARGVDPAALGISGSRPG